MWCWGNWTAACENMKSEHSLNTIHGASLVAQMVKNLPAKQENQLQSLGQEDPLEKRMPIHAILLPGEFHGKRSLVAIVHGVTESRT